MTGRYDVVVVGAGIGGASLAWFLSERASVLLIEAEAHPGLHSTGRSAAFFAETYGGPGVQPLTTASKAFLLQPPEAFADGPLVTPRGALHIAEPDAHGALDHMESAFRDSGVAIERLDADGTAARAPLLSAAWRQCGLWEPGCSDIEVARLHQAFLAGARRRGVALVTNAGAHSLDRSGGRWRVETGAGRFEADVVVNAAGAWADQVAVLAGVRPLGVQPLRRTMIVADLGGAVEPDLPVVLDAAGSFYFKPDAGMMWVSPHDETPVPASDVQPEELDIAIAVDRFETATTATVRRVVRSWAGLRSFAPDRLPVYGFAPDAPGFFWCAGQGGFGVQTSPAAGAMAAALITGAAWSAPGVDPERYSPKRFS
jgi:D-arginine dehydrogenase